MARYGRGQPPQPFVGRVPRATPSGTLAINAAGYEIGDGNDPATMAVEAGVNFDVAVYPVSQWPLSTPTLTLSSQTTSGLGRLANIVSAALSIGTAYRVCLRRVSDGEVWSFTMTAT